MYLLETPDTERLYLVFTLRCNLSCHHCLVNAGSHRNETLPLAITLELIRNAAEIGFRVIYFTGGEVLLYHTDEMIECLRMAKSSGLRTLIETNGSWATDDSITMERLQNLLDAGMDCIATSFDAYHAAQMDMDCVLRIARIARILQIPNRITLIQSPWLEKDTSLANQLTDLRLDFFAEPLMPLGRALAVVKEHALPFMNSCDSIGTTILPNGDVFACCSVNDQSIAMKSTPLYAGNILKEEPRHVLERDFFNPTKRILAKSGHEAFRKSNRPRGKPSSDQDFICALCPLLLDSLEQGGLDEIL